MYLDTHVAVWLYEAEVDLFPRSSRTLLETNELVVSPVVELELQFLFEIGKISEPGNVVVDCLEKEIGLRRCGLPLAQVVAVALDIDWTRDPFDRLIVAQAKARRLPLLTKDETIRDHYDDAVWHD